MGRIMIFKYYPNNGQNWVIIHKEAIHEHDWERGHYKAFESENHSFPIKEFMNYDEYLGWLTEQERKIWLDAKDVITTEELIELTNEEPKDHINPSHYQGYIKTLNEELQWLEAMQYLPRFRNPEVFIGAVELQGRKYWDRNGGKDEEEQELQKGIWYFKFLLAYIKNGRQPIRVADINRLIGDMGQGVVS
jgi:hypothetical protein